MNGGSLPRGESPNPGPSTPPLHIVLFGAGHVGHALVTLFGTLPCVVQWVDARDECFPDEVPPNVQIEATDTPEAVFAVVGMGGMLAATTRGRSRS